MTALGSIRRVWRGRRGMATVELALLLPMILLLTFGTLEVGLMLMTDATLELSMRQAMRYGITNQGGATRDQAISTMVTSVMELWRGSEGKITVTFQAYPSMDSIGKPEPFIDQNDNKVYDAGEDFTDVNGNKQWDSDQAAASSGGSGAVVIYTATLTRPGFSGILNLAGISSLTFSRQMAITNE